MDNNDQNEAICTETQYRLYVSCLANALWAQQLHTTGDSGGLHVLVETMWKEARELLSPPNIGKGMPFTAAVAIEFIDSYIVLRSDWQQIVDFYAKHPVMNDAGRSAAHLCASQRVTMYRKLLTQANASSATIQ